MSTDKTNIFFILSLTFFFCPSFSSSTLRCFCLVCPLILSWDRLMPHFIRHTKNVIIFIFFFWNVVHWTNLAVSRSLGILADDDENRARIHTPKWFTLWCWKNKNENRPFYSGLTYKTGTDIYLSKHFCISCSRIKLILYWVCREANSKKWHCQQRFCHCPASRRNEGLSFAYLHIHFVLYICKFHSFFPSFSNRVLHPLNSSFSIYMTWMHER